MTLSILEWIMLAAMFALSTMYLGDALNSMTAAMRELLEVLRKDKP